MFSSKNNKWCTPRDFFNEINLKYNFNLDPCCTKKSNLCKNYFTVEEDGLKQSWKGFRAFVNPPYGREIGKWVQKCYEENIINNVFSVMLIPSRTDTKWFHNFILGKAEIIFIKGRLKFIDLDYTGKEEDRKISPAPFPSMLVIFNNQQ